MPRGSARSVSGPSADLKADVLLEALPYIQRFAGDTFVVKYGGSSMDDPNSLASFAKNVVLLKNAGINIIVVHGGGSKISDTLGRLGIETKFVDGIRVTTSEAVDVVEMVLSGSVNKRMVYAINEAGGIAMGFSGKDGNLISAVRARKTYKDTDSNIERILDVGYVGVPAKVNVDVLDLFVDTLIVPVISPVGFDEKTGQTYNINADTVAGAIAGAIRAKKLILLTDVDGVKDAKGNLLSSISPSDVTKLIRSRVVTGGMIPKIDTCLAAIEAGVSAVHIINGSTKNSLLLEVMTDCGTGTMFSPSSS